MTVLVEEKVEKSQPVSTIKQRCVDCVKGPNLIKTVVIVACAVIVLQQIATCVRKLIDVPITTYTHFDFNTTIMYPSVTFCREPPYKYEVMDITKTKQLLSKCSQKYGLYSHPRFTSEWQHYNFSKPLDELWDEITYTAEEFFSQFGLDGEVDNVEIKPTIGFVLGRCHTFVPKVPSTRASRESGYSINVQHSAEDAATSTSVHPPGYHVFVHYTREPFTEVEVHNGGLVDYLYINSGETIEVKLTVDVYKKISNEDDPCTIGDDYSANNCTSKYVWNTVSEIVGCSGPWMISDYPRCDSYGSMRALISLYMTIYSNHDSPPCPRFCRALFYNAYITNRHSHMWDTTVQRWTTRVGDAAMQAQVYFVFQPKIFMYFNTMMVSVHEERYNYDWNLFISDLGGSIGFLLGLSVISLMSMCGKVWFSVIRPSIKNPRVKRTSISSSTVTAKVTINQENGADGDLFKKCNNWNTKNDFNDFM